MDLKTVCNKGIRYTDKKRIARGPGSGLGKTAGRGHKGWGQRSGARRRPGYEGGQMPIYRRVPKRGFTNARFRTDYTVINVDSLNDFDEGMTVDLEAVLSRGLASRVTPYFKVLGNGDLKKKLIVRAQKFSKSAVDKIRAAGGSIVSLDEQGREKEYEPPRAKLVKERPAKIESTKPSAKATAEGKKGDGKKAGAEGKKSDGKKAGGTEGKKGGDAEGKASGEAKAKSEKPPKDKPQGKDAPPPPTSNGGG
jgi:large subunit ribosomal protein L15